MMGHFERALALARFGVPAEVQAVALLSAWDQESPKPARRASRFLKALRSLTTDEAAKYLSPDLGKLVSLDRERPDPLTVVKPTAAGTPTPTVDRTVECSTPWLTSDLPFAAASALADDPRRWPEATPQMTCLKYEDLAADGARKRGRLTKRTAFGTPLVNDLVSIETIDITMQGTDRPDGSGHRRYDYVLVSADTGPGLLSLVEDSGWIELCGDADGCQVRIHKRATVRRPVDDPLAPIMSAAFMAELWMWGTGFFVAAGEVRRPSQRDMPYEPKAVARPARGPTRVAVLGGGPAGLACAWLLSNPTVDGKPAWNPPDSTFSLKITLVEAACQPGGKAASSRRTDALAGRVEEHGLHMVMGCYANVQNVLRHTEASGARPRRTRSSTALSDVSELRIPSRPGADVDGPWSLRFASGTTSPSPPFKAVAANTRLASLTRGESRVVAAFFDVSRAPRPLLRSVLATWSRVAVLEPPASTSPVLRLQLSAIQWLHSLVCLFELERVLALSRGQEAVARSHSKTIASLANVLRALSRSALPANDPDPDVRLAGELVELATTVVVGLDLIDLFPLWAIADPGELLDGHYVEWVAGLQTQDSVSIERWLTDNGAVPGFAKRSRLVEAVCAGLFTDPGQIAAGTFINGLARLLLTYDTAPFKRLDGGAGEAFVGPLHRALYDTGVDIRLGTAVESFELDASDVRVASVGLRQDFAVKDGDFDIWPPGTRPGWQRPLQHALPHPASARLEADAYVLAIPPFGQAFDGLPEELHEDLRQIESRATIGVQSWTSGAPTYPDALFSALEGPLRCAAAMSQLVETPAYRFAPVYACGDVDDATAATWSADPQGEARKWLDRWRPTLQAGSPVGDPYVRVNHEKSERYVCANPDTQSHRRYEFQTGVENLWLAGDWTKTALSCGSIEAAVTSGLEAAKHLLQTAGCKVDHFRIHGSLFGEDSR